MRALVDAAMRDGALGVGSALIYAPATYADTDELVALAEVAGRHGGMYISHMRSEGNRLVEAVDEVIEIARRGEPAGGDLPPQAGGSFELDEARRGRSTTSRALARKASPSRPTCTRTKPARPA